MAIPTRFLAGKVDDVAGAAIKKTALRESVENKIKQSGRAIKSAGTLVGDSAGNVFKPTNSTALVPVKQMSTDLVPAGRRAQAANKLRASSVRRRSGDVIEAGAANLSLVPMGETGLSTVESATRTRAKDKINRARYGGRSNGSVINMSDGRLQNPPAVIPQKAKTSSGGGGGSWSNLGKQAWKGFVDNTFSQEGMDRFIGNAIAGAGWGAAIGGTTEALQGGSFVEGAKRGAYQGVVYGGAVGTALGSVARGFNPNASGPRGTYNEISKQLSAVMKNRGAAGAAKGVTGYSATRK